MSLSQYIFFLQLFFCNLEYFLKLLSFLKLILIERSVLLYISIYIFGIYIYIYSLIAENDPIEFIISFKILKFEEQCATDDTNVIFEETKKRKLK